LFFYIFESLSERLRGKKEKAPPAPRGDENSAAPPPPAGRGGD